MTPVAEQRECYLCWEPISPGTEDRAGGTHAACQALYDADRRRDEIHDNRPLEIVEADLGGRGLCAYQIRARGSGGGAVYCGRGVTEHGDIGNTYCLQHEGESWGDGDFAAEELHEHFENLRIRVTGVLDPAEWHAGGATVAPGAYAREFGFSTEPEACMYCLRPLPPGIHDAHPGCVPPPPATVASDTDTDADYAGRWRFTREDNERLLAEVAGMQADFARRPSQRKHPPPTTTDHIAKGHIMSSHIEAACEAVATHIGGFEPESGGEIDAFLSALPNFPIACMKAFQDLANRLAGEYPVASAVTEQLQEPTSVFQDISQALAEAYQTFRGKHDKELERIENPRPGEDLWDIGSQ